MSADAERGTSEMKLAAFYQYVYGGDPVDLTAPAGSWFFDPSATPTAEQIQQLAIALGVEGDVRDVPADRGQGWLVGSDDYSQESVMVSTDATMSWWYNAGDSGQSGFVSCDGGIAVEAGVASDSASGSASEPAIQEPDPIESEPNESEPNESEPIPEPPVCAAPEPPTGVPTADEAEASASELLQSLGSDPASYEFETYADEWAANVTAYLVLDGARSPVVVSAGYGAEGALIWASGFLATPERGSEYPRIGVEAAVQRLNDQTMGWMTGSFGGAGGPAEVAVSTGVTEPVESTQSPVTLAETKPGETDPATDVPAETITTPDFDSVEIEEPIAPGSDPVAIPDPVIDHIPQPEPTVLTLDNPRPSLEMVWADDETVWLLPGYTFDTNDDYGGYVSVLAVEDQYIQLGDPDVPVETVVPVVPVDPLEPGVPDTVEAVPQPPIAVEPSECQPVPTAIEAEAPSETIMETMIGTEWIGLCFDDAAAVAKEQGFQIRIVRIDGVEQAVTMDFRDDRYNVAVVGGVVTEVVSNG